MVAVAVHRVLVQELFILAVAVAVRVDLVLMVETVRLGRLLVDFQEVTLTAMLRQVAQVI